jgi:chromosome segregation ATPase
MKKTLIVLLSFFTLSSCDNGIGENLEALTARLAEVNAELAAATSGMQTDITDISAELQSALETVEANRAEVEQAIATIEGIQSNLDGLLATLENVATSEQAADLLAQVEQLRETMTQIRAIQDDDEDGIMNLVDECPDTEEGVEVGLDGCPIGG